MSKCPDLSAILPDLSGNADALRNSSDRKFCSGTAWISDMLKNYGIEVPTQQVKSFRPLSELRGELTSLFEMLDVEDTKAHLVKILTLHTQLSGALTAAALNVK
jgi:hypothetical protein